MPRGAARRDATGSFLAELLGNDAASFDFIASPLSRASETMEIMRREFSLPSTDYRKDARLSEIHYGRWEGELLSDLPATDPVGFSARTTVCWNWQPADGESYRMLSDRVGRGLKRSGKTPWSPRTAVSAVCCAASSCNFRARKFPFSKCRRTKSCAAHGQRALALSRRRRIQPISYLAAAGCLLGSRRLFGGRRLLGGRCHLGRRRGGLTRCLYLGVPGVHLLSAASDISVAAVATHLALRGRDRIGRDDHRAEGKQSDDGCCEMNNDRMTFLRFPEASIGPAAPSF